MRLQTQLTLSHLLVTISSVVILVVGLLIGYWVYLQSNLSAAWAADVAELYAEDVADYLADDCVACIETLVEDEFLPVQDSPASDEWIVIIDAEGTIIASSNAAFWIGETIWTQLPFGIDSADFIPDTTTYGNFENRHFALTSVDGGGWVYFHGGSSDSAYQLRQTAQTALLASGALGIVALLISGVIGGWMGRFFGRKLTALGSASSAFAAGNLSERVPITSRDEIGRLGQQFNTMADTISQQINDLHQLAETNARLAVEAEGLARLEERNRLARDLHDAVKQQLFGLNLTLGSIPALLDNKPDVARGRLQQVIAQTQAIQIELDQVIKQIRPASLRDQGLESAVRHLVAQWSEQTGVATDVKTEQARELPLPIEQAAYRIVQEALQNVGKHARATHVSVVLRYQRTALALEIIDDGVGFAIERVDPLRSFGLRNMVQRSAELGGTFVVNSSPNGTQLSASLPLENNNTVDKRPL
jgi:NarL family two-component system sensor histidine kinase LiaS